MLFRLIIATVVYSKSIKLKSCCVPTVKMLYWRHLWHHCETAIASRPVDACIDILTPGS